MTYVLRNSHFSNKEMAFSGPWVVWSLFGTPGEKKKRKPNVPIATSEKKYAPWAFSFSRKKETLTLRDSMITRRMLTFWMSKLRQ